MLDDALATGHCVYLHCRAGIGRSAMVAGCWLAERNPGGGAAALDRAGRLLAAVPRSRRSWPQVPETDEQAEFVRAWQPLRPGVQGAMRGAKSMRPARRLALEQRVRGAMARSRARRRARCSAAQPWQRGPRRWHGRSIRRSRSALRRACSSSGAAMRATRSSATGAGQGRAPVGDGPARRDARHARRREGARDLSAGAGLPMAGSHDPKDAAATSLPRVLAAALFAGNDPAAAIALAAECSRTTHQSPLDPRHLPRLFARCCFARCAASRRRTGCRPSPNPCPVAGRPGHCAKTCRPRLPLRRLPGTPAPLAARSTWCRSLALRAPYRRRCAGFRCGHRRGQTQRARRCSRWSPALVGTMFGLQHGIDALPARQARSARGPRAARRCGRALRCAHLRRRAESTA